jgi:ATP-binding cassette subfamily F protein 3
MQKTEKNLLQLQNAAKSFGSRSLFEDATFAVNENEHIGVIGPNGAGKTTLFRMLTGELELDEGKIVRSQSLRLGYLQQHDQWKEGESVEDYLQRGCSKPIWELKQLAQGLGLKESQFALPIQSLSGGYRMRVKLLHLLGEEPNLMLLDEPTNYLDLETMLVLESFLQSFEGAFLLISHDREFLRRTTDHILEVEAGDFVKYNGNIDDYFEQKELLREQLEKQALSQQAQKKKVLDFAARFGAKASKARQVQSRLKQMNKMESIEVKALPVGAKINIPPPPKTGRLALELKNASLGYPQKTVLRNVDLKVESGDRIGVVGFNGAGKSTFLKSIGKLIPTLSGEVEWGYQVGVSVFSQHVAEALNLEHDVYDALESVSHQSIRPQEILNLAGSLLFSGDDVKKKISVLSGGERSRVALGQILLQKSPVLLLDEPTNHLDFYTVEALTQALQSFSGTLIVVSHDRGFIRRVSNKILEVKAGHLRLYPGDYDQYVWSLQQSRVFNEIYETEEDFDSGVIEDSLSASARGSDTAANPDDGFSSALHSPGNLASNSHQGSALHSHQGSALHSHQGLASNSHQGLASHSQSALGSTAHSDRGHHYSSAGTSRVGGLSAPLSERDKGKLKDLQKQKRTIEKDSQETDRKIKILEKRLHELVASLDGKSGAEATKLSMEMTATQKKIEELEQAFMEQVEQKDKLDLEMKTFK